MVKPQKIKTLLHKSKKNLDSVCHKLCIFSTLNLIILPCRAVYDGEEPDMFMQRLDARIKGHDKEIERMCNFHYQGFIDSIQSLLQVREDVESLKVLYLF